MWLTQIRRMPAESSQFATSASRGSLVHSSNHKPLAGSSGVASATRFLKPASFSAACGEVIEPPSAYAHETMHRPHMAALFCSASSTSPPLYSLFASHSGDAKCCLSPSLRRELKASAHPLTLSCLSALRTFLARCAPYQVGLHGLAGCPSEFGRRLRWHRTQSPSLVGRGRDKPHTPQSVPRAGQGWTVKLRQV